jgi:hypothetical protein
MGKLVVSGKMQFASPTITEVLTYVRMQLTLITLGIQHDPEEMTTSIQKNRIKVWFYYY